MILKQSQLWLHLFTIFLFYTNNSAKSRSQDRQERINNRKEATINTLKAAGRPSVPKCQWARFEELPLKVQQGAQSSVSILIDKFNKEPVIKKVYSERHDFVNELKALTTLRADYSPLLAYPLCVDSMKMILVLEWGGEGDLTRWDLFRDQNNRFTYSDIVKLSGQIVAAVIASHRRGILHGDIKPENFVINLKKKSTKLIDFGLSARLGEFRVMTQGTPITMPPEVAFLDYFANRFPYGPDAPVKEENLRKYVNQKQRIKVAMDWWSVGVTIHYLFAKFFEDEDRRIRIESEIFAPDNSRIDSDDSRTNSDDSRTNSDSNSHSDVTSGSDTPKLIVDDSESDDHYFPYKVEWTKDGRDILNFKYRPIPESFPPNLKDLIQNKFMAWEQEDRNFEGEKLDEILEHSFFSKINWDEIDPSIKESE